jgi:TRAP-type C4-dicarboxylate transport system substrate-binding protein
MAKYYSLTEHSFAPTPVIFSKKIFDQYPPAIKEAVLQAAQEMIPAARVAVDKTLEEAYGSISKDGGIVNKVNKELFIKAAQPAIKKLGEKIDPDLLQKILDTQ